MTLVGSIGSSTKVQAFEADGAAAKRALIDPFGRAIRFECLHLGTESNGTD